MSKDKLAIPQNYMPAYPPPPPMGQMMGDYHVPTYNPNQTGGTKRAVQSFIFPGLGQFLDKRYESSKKFFKIEAGVALVGLISTGIAMMADKTNSQKTIKGLRAFLERFLCVVIGINTVSAVDAYEGDKKERGYLI